ncbi:hypothetical protein CGOTT_08610 [Corynebacterium gottingense]|uniref:Uncharacterized protein n=1 Tax=Corynebacterium gottingense TaxID=2041036 RepID=A0ABX9ULL9_9CORY|nr:hypothetical protein EAW56_03550 [Corynebacterium gottingense]WJZ13636.1 hypothetical protein CGOTT_08610 [Corynebacterium gottingense]WJZ15951.1 hypothetical protein CGOTTB_08560 [Corynebacterium gottingense]
MLVATERYVASRFEKLLILIRFPQLSRVGDHTAVTKFIHTGTLHYKVPQDNIAMSYPTKFADEITADIKLGHPSLKVTGDLKR